MSSEHPFYTRPRALFVFRVFVGMFFIFASFDKILDPRQFADDIQNYRLLPYGVTHLLAMTLPWLEFIAGLLLVCGVWTRSAALMVCLMLTAFVFGLVSAIARHLDIGCGCYHGASASLRRRVAEDVFLLWMSGLVVLKGPGLRLVEDDVESSCKDAR